MLAIGILRDDELEPAGTGFLIGPALAFTASHVVSEAIAESPRRNCFVVASQIVNRGETPLLWNVRTVNRMPSAAEANDRPMDIALLELEPCGDRVVEIEENRRWFFELNVATPRIGQRVVAYGFSQSEIRRSESDSLAFESTHAFRRVEGIVSEVRWPFRDIGLLPFPCFAVHAEFEAGMSGGPVFNDRYQVCGVVSCGGIPGVSWASIIWPALAIRLDGAYLPDHARSGRIRARNHHCVSFRPQEEGPVPTILFDPEFQEPW